MFNDLKNKICLVTGAGGKLGLYHGKAILEKDGFLIMCDVNGKKNLKNYNVLKKLFPEGRIIVKTVDITYIKAVNQFKKSLEKKKVYIDVLINNAALDSVPGKLKRNIDDEIFKSFNVGVLGAVNLIEAFSKDMKKKKHGSIINIGSDLSLIAPNQRLYKGLFKKFIKPVHYSITKHAIIGVTRYYASLLGDYNIRCNALCPGPMDDAALKLSFKQRLEKTVPLGRMGHPNELVGAIQFLSSDQSSYITGQNLLVDGGRTVLVSSE